MVTLWYLEGMRTMWERQKPCAEQNFLWFWCHFWKSRNHGHSIEIKTIWNQAVRFIICIRTHRWLDRTRSWLRDEVNRHRKRLITTLNAKARQYTLRWRRGAVFDVGQLRRASSRQWTMKSKRWRSLWCRNQRETLFPNDLGRERVELNERRWQTIRHGSRRLRTINKKQGHHFVSFSNKV